jgi:ACS family D-galactonate transporter-like MFS transporter
MRRWFRQIRFRVSGMLFITIAINYLDRSNLSVAAIDLSRDLQLDPVQLGKIFSGFGWAYAAFQIPGGWLVDRFGARKLYATICALWSVATLTQGLVSTFAALFGLRLLLGLFEAPSFPLCSKLSARWYPDHERAAAVGFYTAGQFVGLAFLTPVLVWTQQQFNWRAVFLLTGAIGLAWALFWHWRYRDPAQARGLSEAERKHIRDGGGWVDTDGLEKSAGGFRWVDLRFVLSQRKLWGLYFGQFALNSVPWFFLTWFPTYLATYRHFDFIHARYMTSVPFLGAFAGVLAGGFASDWMTRRGVSPSLARKGPIILGRLLSTSVVGANFVDQPGWVVFFLTLAFFGNGFASITWALVSLIAPRRLMGLTGGVFNLFGNLASICVPIAIGVIVQQGGFAPALALVSTIALLGALSYLFVVGSVERVPDPGA